MQTSDLFKLQEELAQSFATCLHNAFSRALAAQAAKDPRVAQDLREQLHQQCCDDLRPYKASAFSARAVSDVVDVPFREVPDTPRQA